MPQPASDYSNAGLTERIEAAIKPFNPQAVTLELRHEETIRKFIERVEEVHRRSREVPVKLRRESAHAGPGEAAVVPVMTASLLRKLPANLRDRVLQAVAEAAAHDYETDPELTDFDAFGEGNHG